MANSFNTPEVQRKLTTLEIPGNIRDVSPEINKMRPIDYIIQRIREIQQDPNARNVLIVHAETGSGKSTAQPAVIFNVFQQMVICTQPAVYTAKSIPGFIGGKSPDKPVASLELGRNVGYQAGGEKRAASKEPNLTYVTTGVVVQRIKNSLMRDANDIFGLPKFIIIDEAHARSIEMDNMLLLTKMLVNRMKKTSPFFIITSATMDIDKYTTYFEVPGQSLSIRGQQGTINEVFPKYDIANYIEAAAKLSIELATRHPYKKGVASDIIIFVPTKKIAKTIKDKLIGDYGLDESAIHVDLLDRVIVVKDQQSKFMNAGKQQIILATPVAETGATIETLTYSIDTGFVNSVEYNPYYKATLTCVRPITRASATQRRGRVGRMTIGSWYPLYTKETFNLMQPFTNPDILQNDKALGYLSMMDTIEKMQQGLRQDVPSSDLGDPVRQTGLTQEQSPAEPAALLDPIPEEMLSDINDKLMALGFISKLNTMTELGRLAANFITVPADITVEAVKMMLSGYAYNVCVADLATIAAAQSQGFTISTHSDIADQFVETIIYIDQQLHMQNINNNHDSPELYNEEYNEDFKTPDDEDYSLATILDIRQNILECFANMGMSPYNAKPLTNILPSIASKRFYEVLNTGEFDTVLRAYKRCIYEGYKLNLVQKTQCKNGISSYVNLRKQNVLLNMMYSKEDTDYYKSAGTSLCESPNYCVAHHFELRLNQHTNLYRLHAIGICSLDGFIGVDETFFNENPNVGYVEVMTDDNWKKYQELLSRQIGTKLSRQLVIEPMKMQTRRFMVNELLITGGDREYDSRGADTSTTREIVSHTIYR